MEPVHCSLCARDLNRARRRPMCASCAQAMLYEPRLRHLSTLLTRESAHTRAEATIRPGNDGILAALPQDTDFDAITAGITKNARQCLIMEQETVEVRISAILEKAEDLRAQIAAHRDTLARGRRDQETRRRKLLADQLELEKVQPAALEPVRAVTRKVAHRLQRTREKLIDARMVLCREAALACNFTRRKRLEGRSDYVLGGIVIPDLKEFNTKTQPLPKSAQPGGRTIAEPFELVTEAVDNVARLVSICAHYLQVRPPAEIILPHEDFPRAVIMTEKSSYRSRDVSFPRTSTSRSSTPVSSRILDRPDQPRPRPLFLDRPLAQLSKEDPKSYGLFVEGVSLLAWDIAWICKSQGMDTVNSFDDFCSIGRNLWHLLMTQHQRPTKPVLDRRVSGASGKSDTPSKDGHNPSLGRFSHASVQHNLASLEGVDIFRDWRLINPARLIDKLKSLLLTEISGAEWDLLDEAEWTQDRGDDAITVAGLQVLRPARSSASASVAGQDSGDTDSAAEARRRKSSSGWMKVRGRTNDA